MAFFSTLFPRFDDEKQKLEWKTAAILALGAGISGSDTFTDGASHSGNWFILHAITDITITSLTYRDGTHGGNSLAGTLVKAGDRIYGWFTEVQASGVYEMYRPPTGLP